MRQDLGEIVVEPQVGRDGRGNGPAVAGQHHAPVAHGPEFGHGLPGLGTDHVREREGRERPAPLDEEDHGLAPRPGLRYPFVREPDAVLLEEPGAHHPESPAGYGALDPAAGQGTELRHCRDDEAAAPCLLHDPPRDRVFARRLERGRVRERDILRDLAERYRGGHPEAALGERPGLVEDHDAQVASRLERLPVPDQESRAGRERGRDRDHERDGEAQRVRAGDHHHRHGPLDGEGDRFTVEEPPREGDRADGHGHDGQDERGRVGEILGPRPGLLRLPDEFDHLREVRLLPGRGDPDGEHPLAVDRAAEHAFTRRPPDGLRLAGQHGLVHARRPPGHLAVDRDLLSRPDLDLVADHELAHGHVDGPAAADDMSLGGHDPRQGLERPGGAEDRSHLDVMAEEHDVDQGRELPEESHARHQPDHDGRGVDVGDRDRERDQGHHADPARPDLLREPTKERPATVDVDDGGEEKDRVLPARDRELDAREFLHLGGQHQDRDREDQ